MITSSHLTVWPAVVEISAEIDVAVRRQARNAVQHSIDSRYGSAEGLHYIRGAIDQHTDATICRWTMGLILINDCDARLWSHRSRHLPLPPGTVYRLDPGRRHGTRLPASADPDGLCAFYALDMDICRDPAALVQDILASIEREYLAVQTQTSLCLTFGRM